MREIIKLTIKITAFILYPFYFLYNLIFYLLIERIRLELIIIKLKNNNSEISKKVWIGKRFDISIGNNGKLIIGENVSIADDVYIKVGKNARLEIGDNVNINKGTRISAFESIVIGSNTLIASYCNILDHNHQFDLQSPASTEHYDCGPIVIKDGSWLGTKVQVNKGVTIGRFTVIAANAVVTKDALDSCIYGGIPAKKIKCFDQ